MTILKEIKPIARKEHRCMFCYGIIRKGQQYFRQTNIVDGIVGDWVCHQECQDVARELGMYDNCDPDYGLSDEEFGECINQYIYDEHYDKNADDIESDWQDLTRYEEVCRILMEIEAEKVSNKSKQISDQ